MSPQQLAVLDCVRTSLEQFRVAPTYDEIARAIGCSSKGNVAKHVDALIDQGHLVRTRAQVRNLALAGSVDLAPVDSAQLRAELARRGEPVELAWPDPRTESSAACAARRCRHRVERGQVFCRPHYLSLPTALRRDLLGAYSAGQRERYGEAFRQAQDVINERETAR